MKVLIGETRVCKRCGTSFERKVRTAQVYCSTKCRRAANNSYQSQNMQRWHKENPHVSMLRTLKHRAKKKGLEFNITKEDLVIPEYCPILGIKIESNVGKGSGGKMNSPSVDRIDNNLGYIKGNVWVISQLANAMKSQANPEQLVAFAKWVMSEYG